MALTQAEINAVMQQLQPIITKALNESTSIAQAQANIQQGVTQYIGARYVPLFADPIEWDNTRAYEPLTIVLYQGNSFTTRQYTPAGIDINNAAFWAETGNYNAQVEGYRKEVQDVKAENAENTAKIAENTDKIAENTDKIAENTGKIGELSNQLSGSVESGLLGKIDQLADQPIEFTVIELSDTQTVLLAKITKQSIVIGLAYTNGVDGKPTSNVTSWAQKQSGTMLALNCDRYNVGVGAYNNIVNGVIDTAGASSNATNANYLAFNTINDLTVIPREGHTIAAIKDMGYNNAFVCGYALMTNGTPSDIPDDYANGYEPQLAMGWSDTHVYVAMCSGRSVMQTGVTPNELFAIFNERACTTAILLDGGGSVQAAYRHGQSCARITPYPAISRNVPLTLSFKPTQDTSINTTSHMAIERFNAAYSANRNTFMRSHGKIIANAKTGPLSSGFALESDIFNGVAPEESISANSGGTNIFTSVNGWNSAKIRIPKRQGTAFWATVKMSAHLTLRSTTGGTYKLGFERFAGDTPYIFSVTEGAYSANTTTPITLEGLTTMNMIRDADTVGYIEVIIRTSTECTITSFNATELWQYGEV